VLPVGWRVIENFLLVLLAFQMVIDSISFAKLTTIPAPLVDPFLGKLVDPFLGNYGLDDKFQEGAVALHEDVMCSFIEATNWKLLWLRSIFWLMHFVKSRIE
jgi:hypothetical protein